MGIVIGLIVFFLAGGPKEIKTTRPQEAWSPEPTQPSAPDQMDASGESSAVQAVPPASGTVETGTPLPASVEEESYEPGGMPAISLPAETDDFDLASLPLPPLPYCIYTGAYKDFPEAATTQSELDSNYLPAYIVPVEVKGNVAQSLFGVTQDGLWYRVLTGHFGSKEEARKTLRMMMEELPGYQPEIMRFRYTVECGRYLVPEEARTLSERLDQENVFHYTQAYPTNLGNSLTRVLVGCYFSERSAEDEVGRLQGKGFSCTVTER